MSLADEHDLPKALQAATEEQVKEYYSFLNNKTLKADIYPERSLKELKRMFDKENRERKKKFKKGSRSYFAPKVNWFENPGRMSVFLLSPSELTYPQDSNKSNQRDPRPVSHVPIPPPCSAFSDG